MMVMDRSIVNDSYLLYKFIVDINAESDTYDNISNSEVSNSNSSCHSSKESASSTLSNYTIIDCNSTNECRGNTNKLINGTCHSSKESASSTLSNYTIIDCNSTNECKDNIDNQANSKTYKQDMSDRYDINAEIKKYYHKIVSIRKRVFICEYCRCKFVYKKCLDNHVERNHG